MQQINKMSSHLIHTMIIKLIKIYIHVLILLLFQSVMQQINNINSHSVHTIIVKCINVTRIIIIKILIYIYILFLCYNMCIYFNNFNNILYI
jgi:hypothetical protein